MRDSNIDEQEEGGGAQTRRHMYCVAGVALSVARSNQRGVSTHLIPALGNAQGTMQTAEANHYRHEVSARAKVGRVGHKPASTTMRATF